jgi:hypothetical protein
MKALSELAVAHAWLHQRMTLSAQSPNCSVSQLLARWLEFIANECENSLCAEVAQKYPAKAFAMLLPYLAIRASGFRVRQYECALSMLRRWGYPGVAEQLPYRILDLQYFLWKSGLTKKQPAWHALYKQTTLGKATTSIYLTEDDAYSITHTIFYVTDLGNRNFAAIDSDKARIIPIVESLLFHFNRVSNWDLTGELLISLDCLRARHSWSYMVASKSFQRALRSDGSVPPNRHSRSPKSMDPTRLFRRYYHTTLVGAIYCSISLGGT